ncbi:hypothetical protein [Thermospira aquatica]|uniref:Uncharacterized protein n=1 Tax=Thermospira aquatica TaxID=2828656 RepID=A0AAX3BAW0_9SPIR|nr:hypothetical protein [Thermospira aquatica]URA09411.1 hypothetical protein KDW03_07905 [Thermospira aquatica]
MVLAGGTFALSGDADSLDMSGRSLKVTKDGKMTIVEVEKWANTPEKGGK